MQHHPAYTRTALVLPLHTLADILDPTPYSPPIRIAVWDTSEHLDILFTGCAELFGPEGDVGRDRGASWETCQRFLGVVYAWAMQEAGRVGRQLMQVDVRVEGWAAPRGRGWVKGEWDRVVADPSTLDIFSTPPPAHTLTTLPALRSPGRPIIPAPHPPTVPHTPSAPLERGGRYPVVALGGTFDHLHAGHKILLSMAVWITAQRLIVGVSADDLLVSKVHPEQLEPLSTRIARTRAFLESLDQGLEYEIVELREVAGPTGKRADVHALVVSRESVAGGDAIAKIRKERNFPPLDVFVIDVISSSIDSLTTVEGSYEEEKRRDEDRHGLVGETDQERLKAGKMSSTLIRQLLAERCDREAAAE